MSDPMIHQLAQNLRKAIDEYDEATPAVYKNGNLKPGAAEELAAVDPVLEAAEHLLEVLMPDALPDEEE